MSGRLLGRVIATTRDGSADDSLVQGLTAEGATVRVWPTLRFSPPRDVEALDEALSRLAEFDWVTFTSPRGVQAVSDRTEKSAGRVRIAAVGRATAEIARDRGWPPDVVGEGGAAELVGLMAERGLAAGQRVLFPAASEAREDLEEALADLGAHVERVTAYRTQVSPPDKERVREDLERGVDAVVFASPSAARSLSIALHDDLERALADVFVVAIGPTTEAALKEFNLPNVVVAGETSMEGLVEACCALPFPHPPRTSQQEASR